MVLAHKYKTLFFYFSITVPTLVLQSCACEFISLDLIQAMRSPFQKPPFSSFIAHGESDTNSAGGLQSIFYNYKAAIPDEVQLRALEQNSRLLIQNPEVSIVIESYCDPIGGVVYNQKLGQKRAEYVLDFLKSNGISEERIQIKVYGSTKAIALEEGFDKAAFMKAFNKDRRINFSISSVLPQKSYKSSFATTLASYTKVHDQTDIIRFISTPVKAPISLIDHSRKPSSLEIEGESDLHTAGELESLYFDYKKHKIDHFQKDTLTKNADYLLKNKNLSIKIQAHCDPIGGKEYNRRLAKKRLDSITKIFKKKGIDMSRISSEIIETEDTNLTRKLKNQFPNKRRVNFIVLSID